MLLDVAARFDAAEMEVWQVGRGMASGLCGKIALCTKPQALPGRGLDLGVRFKNKPACASFTLGSAVAWGISDQEKEKEPPFRWPESASQTHFAWPGSLQKWLHHWSEGQPRRWEALLPIGGLSITGVLLKVGLEQV